MNISTIGTELANLENKIKDEATLSESRKQTMLQNIEACRIEFRKVAQDIDNSLSALAVDAGGHFDEHIQAINELVKTPKAAVEQHQEAA